MYLLLIAAALSNQLWFETQQQDEALILTPMARLVDDCRCQLTIQVIHQGQSGQSHSRQSGEIALKGQRPQALATMRLELPQGEWTQITVTLRDGSGRILQQSWHSPTRV